jgi:hypothetical protein
LLYTQKTSFFIYRMLTLNIFCSKGYAQST